MESLDECNERDRLKMRLAVLEESVRSSEVECKGSQETVLRLTAELDRERRKAASSSVAVDALKVELDGLTLGKSSLEVEKRTLMERLEASKRVAEASRRESLCLEKQVEELERKLQMSQRETQEAGDKLLKVLTKVSSLIQGDAEVTVRTKDKKVLLEADKLCSKAVSEVQARLHDMSEALSEERKQRQSILQRTELAEQQVSDLRRRLQHAEAELLAADAQRHGLRLGRRHHEEFLDRLSEAMKVDAMAADVGTDMRLPLILSRAEQLVRCEGDALMESKILTFNLQRKLKTQKEQLESKGLHIQMLRKKLTELEDEKRRRSSLEDIHAESRRLQKKVDRLQGELRASRQSNSELKARLSDTTADLKLMDFRMVVSQLVGVDATASSSLLPSHEIIRLLEDRLHSHHHQQHGNTPWFCAAHQSAHLPSSSHASVSQDE
ncbi:coiled-coil domain-containing protein 170 isoform X2 [Dunckerocampus dactyliophorus]|uniref:coiled-coil domain-containing protein 170 isoform X2 n=1 Tax=Dunckerocampus dactyliophorus TaxID=161453 RepID=UPI002404E616|nr:coiled-coil domain-containing protein 170 isoform X2 [Dunckerocampus dactyliophorus]